MLEYHSKLPIDRILKVSRLNPNLSWRFLPPIAIEVDVKMFPLGIPHSTYCPINGISQSTFPQFAARKRH